MTNKAAWLINGCWSKEVLASDRGLAYGDGLFETMRAIGGNIPLWQKHRERFLLGCDRLGITPDIDRIESDLEQAISKAFGSQAPSNQILVKLLCSRGGQASGYQADESQANIYIKVLALDVIDKAKAQESRPLIKAQVCDHRLAVQPALAGIKHLNRLDQVLAAQELAPGFDEGLLFDTDGHLIEAISSNIILVKGKTLFFPFLDSSGVKGVMQAFLYENAAELGFEVENIKAKVDSLAEYEEILATNAVRGLRNIDAVNISSMESIWQSASFSVGDQLRQLLCSKLSSEFVSF